MNALALSVVLILAIGWIIGHYENQARHEGFKEGNATGYELGKKEVHYSAFLETKRYTIYNTTVSLGDYVIHFHKTNAGLPDDLAFVGLTGYTYYNRTIGLIVDDRTLPSIYETCVHERGHDIHPDWPEDKIVEYAKSTFDEGCIKLAFWIYNQTVNNLSDTI